MVNSKETSMINKYFFAVLVLLIIPISGVSIDIYVPSLPAVGHYFGVGNAKAQLSITTYMLGLGVMQLFAGGISDSFGRKKPFLIAMAIYIAVTLDIVFAANIYQLLELRLIQGIAVAMMVVPLRSVIPDLFEGPTLYKMMNYMVMSWSIGPIVAPALGGYLQHYFGWQANFYFLAIYSLIAFILIAIYLPETSQHRHPFQMLTILKRYQEMLLSREYVSGLIINGMLYSVIILFAIVGPFLIQNVLHYSAVQFGHVALLTGLAWFLGATTNRFLRQVGLNTKAKICLSLMLVISILMTIIAKVLPISIFLIVGPIFILLWVGGILFPNYFALGMALFPKNTGSANALFGSIIFLMTGMSSGLGTFLKSTNMLPLSLAYVALIGFGLIVYAVGFKQHSNETSGAVS